MKNKLLVLMGVAGLALAGCSSGEETADTTEETTQAEEVAVEETQAEETQAEGSQEYNETLVDDENFSVVLTTIEESYDDIFDETKVEVNMTIENKTDASVEVQARSLSVNDVMVDQAAYIFSQEVGPGKTANATLDFTDLGGGEVPEMTGTLEGSLVFIDSESFSDVAEYPISVELK